MPACGRIIGDGFAAAQPPLRTYSSASSSRRVAASIRVTAMSATEAAFAPGLWPTAMLRFAAAARSTPS